MSELLAIKASRSSDVVMFPFPETAVAAAAAALSCLIFRPNALLNDAYKRRKRKETTIVSSKVQRQIRQIVTLT